MTASIDWHHFTDTPLQADLMRRLSRLYERTKLERHGERWTAPKVDWLAAQLGVHKSTISRALKALAARGLILIQKWRWSRSPRLYIRVLVRPRATSTQRERNLTETQNATCYYNTGKEITPSGNTGGGAAARQSGGVPDPLPEKDTPPQSPPSPAAMEPTRKTGKKLSGKADGIQARVEGRQGAGGQSTPTNPHKPGSRELARRWDGLLRAYDGNRIDVDDVKTLRHVGIVRDRLKAKGIDVWDELPRMIDRWTAYSLHKSGKTPVPWAMLRSLDTYLEYRAAMAKPATVEPATPAPAPTPDPAPVQYAAPVPGHYMTPTYTGLWAKIKAKKAAATNPLSKPDAVIKGGTDETFKDDGE